MRNSRDRRESKRISYLCEVECQGAGLSHLATRINDLSMTGAFIDSMTCYAPGASLRLRFHVMNVRIETTAEVRYSMPKVGMGVRFLDLKPDHLAALQSLVDGKPLSVPRPAANIAATSQQEPNEWNTPDMLLGNFAIVSLFDVIQIIENNRLCGALNVQSSVARGYIQFNEGQIVGARAGVQEGIQALKRFLDVTEGSFEFKRASGNYPRSIDAKNNMSLMLDLLRVKDEETGALQNSEQ
ncbi:MAG: DUF4388 domain-containing protein [Blastocatellia bacterium]